MRRRDFALLGIEHVKGATHDRLAVIDVAAFPSEAVVRGWYAQTDGPGRRLVFTDGIEPVIWCVGPSEVLRSTVIDAVTARRLA